MRRAALLIGLCATLVVSGCGDLGPDDPEPTRQPSDTLTQKDIERLDSDSPARTVLSWWRALQFGNPGGAAELYAPTTGITAERLNNQLRYAPKYFNFLARPAVQGIKYRGPVATVSLLLRSTTEAANGREDVIERPLAVRLVRVNGRWRLTDNLYLERLVTDAQLSERMELIELRTRASRPQ